MKDLDILLGMHNVLQSRLLLPQFPLGLPCQGKMRKACKYNTQSWATFEVTFQIRNGVLQQDFQNLSGLQIGNSYVVIIVV